VGAAHPAATRLDREPQIAAAPVPLAAPPKRAARAVGVLGVPWAEPKETLGRGGDEWYGTYLR